MTLKNPTKRTSFLHRNWISGLTTWQSPTMGNVPSSPESEGRSHPDPRRRDDAARPLKRRRISSSEPFAIDDHLIGVPAPGTSETSETLRVDVLKVIHKDSKKVRSHQPAAAPRDSLNTKANCKITISDLSSGKPEVLFCQTQSCHVTAFKNPIGPHRVARVALSRPFTVPMESILVHKTDGSIDFSGAYQLIVELKAANDSHWPPLDSSDFGVPFASATSNRHCTMMAQCDRIFGRVKTPMSLKTGFFPNQSTRQTDYVMDVDLRWATGLKAPKGSMPCITAVDPDVEPEVNDHLEPILNGGLNGVDGLHADLYPDLDDDLDGELTPSRSLRVREKHKVYNLKVLSDQAQGKERKRRARGNTASSEGRISYLLPTDQPVCLDYHRCVTCGAYHHSMLELQVHLQTAHPKYEYVLDTTSQVPQFRVTSRFEPNASPSKTYQLGRALKPFNLETYVSGDQSWLASRLGPESFDDAPISPAKKNIFDGSHPGSHLGSPVPKAAKVAQRRAGRSNRVLVPETGQPLFHPVSKAQLKVGHEVPDTAADYGWLLQKHREAIGDFSDVTPSEKEYIIEWDGYILQQSITTTAYFPRAWLSFVKERAAWLVAAEHRMLEFGKHTSVLLARDVLNDQVMDEALTFINQARAGPQLKEEQHDVSMSDGALKQSPRASHIRKNDNGCTVCQLPVLGPRLLLCSNKVRESQRIRICCR